MNSLKTNNKYTKTQELEDNEDFYVIIMPIMAEHMATRIIETSKGFLGKVDRYIKKSNRYVAMRF